MYDELVKRLRETSCGAEDTLWWQAADAIEELQAEINGWVDQERAFLLKSVPKWIPVSERLPDYPGRFMCYYEIDDCGEVGHCIDWGSYNPDDGWYVSGVTHWQSLPEPPKEE